MFTLPERQNPLGQILQGLTEAAGPYIQQRKAQKSQNAIFDLLSNLGEDATPMQFTRALYSNPNIRAEDRQAAAKTYFDMQNAQTRKAAANRLQASRGGGTHGEFSPAQLQAHARHVEEAEKFGFEPKSIHKFFRLPEPEEENVETPINEGMRRELPRVHNPQTERQAANLSTHLNAPASMMQTPAQQAQKPITPERIAEAKAEAKPELEQDEYDEFSRLEPLSYEKLMSMPKDEFIPPYKGKARNDWIEARRKENKKIFEEAKSRSVAKKHELQTMANLEALNDSGKLPSGWSEKIKINPETGDIRDFAKIFGNANVETQRWVKEIASLVRNLKNTFGSRITNFDIESYMRQFPSLMNTEEGRRQLIKQITMVNKLNGLHDDALQAVYKKYELGGITPEKADELASRMIAPTARKYREAIKQIGMEAAMSPGAAFDEPPPGVYPEGEVLEDDDGNAKFIFEKGKWRAV